MFEAGRCHVEEGGSGVGGDRSGRAEFVDYSKSDRGEKLFSMKNTKSELCYAIITFEGAVGNEWLCVVCVCRRDTSG
jgi:hypothetical protein